VTLTVSVVNANAPLVGLTAADFRLRDNGELQTIEAFPVEAQPIDLTLFIDTSPSFAGRLDELKRNIRTIANLLRPIDRIRLITFGREVDDIFGWQSATSPLNLDAVRVSTISPVYDGIAEAILQPPTPDRRQLAVAITDGVDYNGAVGSESVLEIAARTDVTLCLVVMPSSLSRPPNAPDQWIFTMPDALGQQNLDDAAKRTGGRVYAPLRLDLVRVVSQALRDYRSIYILTYVPSNLQSQGWHEIKVEVPSRTGAVVRSRRGYYSGRRR